MKQTALPVEFLPPAALLAEHHYLGRSYRSEITHQDGDGVLVFAAPNSRRLPAVRWLELVRWCLTGGPNAGSRQWSRVWRWLRGQRPEVTTVVSYSDPSAGHTGALYRACGWLWAPTWHRLRTPPTGNGSWDGAKVQAAKDRWIFPLRPDSERAAILAIRDEGLRRRFPWAEYREPRFRRDVPVVGSGGGDYSFWAKGVLRDNL